MRADLPALALDLPGVAPDSTFFAAAGDSTFLAAASDSTLVVAAGRELDGALTGGQIAGGVVVGLVMLGFVIGGVLAYRGTWRPLRRAMIADREGHRMAGALWLGLLLVPIAMSVLSDPAPDGGFSAVQWVAWGLMALLLLATMALSFNRPAALTRLLTPRWLLRERAQRFGELGRDGRPVRDL